MNQIPVGPVHAGIIEPGHFRFHASGETVVRLEERLGYLHKGVEGIARRRGSRAAQLVGRVSGDSTVAYAYRLRPCRRTAVGFAPPPRARVAAGADGGRERIANHFGDFGGICNDAAFALMLAHPACARTHAARGGSRLRPPVDDGLRSSPAASPSI